MDDNENQDEGSFDEGADVTANPFLMASFTVLNTLEWTQHDVFSGLGFKQLGLAWDLLQPLAVVMNPYMGWNSVIMEKPIYLGLFLSFFWDPNVVGMTSTGSMAVFWVCVAVIIGMAVIVLTRTGFDNEKVMCGVRMAVRSLTSPLYWPVLNILLSRLVCVDREEMDAQGGVVSRQHLWLYEEEQCSGGLHIAEVVAGSVAIALHCTAGLVAVATLFDVSSFSDDPLARANTTVDILMWVYKTGTSLSFFLLLSRGMHVELGCILVLLSLGILAFIVTTCPYYQDTTNSAMAATFASVAWFAFMSCFADPKSPDLPTDVLVAAWAIFPFIYAGTYGIGTYGLASIRVSRACSQRFEELLSGQASPQKFGVFPKYLPDNDQIVSKLSDLEGWLLELESTLPSTASADQAYTTGDHNELDLMLPYIENIHFASDIELSTRFLNMWDRGIGGRPSLRMLAMASRIFTKGLCKYPHEREVEVQFALFLIRYLERSHVTIRFITGLESSHAQDRFQVISAYTIYKMANTLRTNLGIRDRSHCQALEHVRQHHHEALELMHNFWLKVQEAGEGLRGLAGLANQITDRREKAKLGFRWMLRQHPQDTQILLQLASFLKQVMLDQTAYERCLDEVDNIQHRRAASPAHTNRNGSAATSKTGMQEGSNAIGLLDPQKTVNGKGNEGHVGSTVRVLQLTIRIAFIPLVLLLVAEFIVAFLYAESHKDMVHQVYAAGQVRYLCQRAGVTLQHIIGNIVRESAEQQQTDSSMSVGTVQERAKLHAITRALEAHHNAVTVGSRGVSYPDHMQFLKSHSAVVDYYDMASAEPVPEIVTPWHLGNLVVTALTELLQVSTVQDIPSHKYTSILIDNLAGSVSHVFNESASLVEDHSRDAAEVTKTAAVLLFLTGVVMVFVVYLLFVWNFNKIATGKITTLELFTLIPEATLQATAEDAKAKLKSFQEDSENDQDRTFTAIVSSSQDMHSEQNSPEQLYQGGKRASSAMPVPQLMIPEVVASPVNGAKPPAGMQAFPSSEPEGNAALLVPDMKHRPSMTDQEAKESLSTRKDSTMALVLKKGMAESMSLSDRPSMRRSAGGHPVLGPAGGDEAKDGAAEEKQDGAETHISEDAKFADKSTASTDTETSETKSSQNEEQQYLMAVGLIVVLLGIAVAGAVETFALSPAALADAYSRDDRALQDTLRFREVMSGLSNDARLFAQSGDVVHYDAYWETMHAQELTRLQHHFWSLGLKPGEIDTLEAALKYFDELHERHLISFTLAAAENGGLGRLDELSGVTWDTAALSREMLGTFATVFPSIYTHTTKEEDTKLPTASATAGVMAYSQRLSDIGVMAALCTTGLPTEGVLAALVAAIDEWVAGGEALAPGNDLRNQISATGFADLRAEVTTPLRAAAAAAAAPFPFTAAMASKIDRHLRTLVVVHEDTVLQVGTASFPVPASETVAMAKVDPARYGEETAALYTYATAMITARQIYMYSALSVAAPTSADAALESSNAAWATLWSALPSGWDNGTLLAVPGYQPFAAIPGQLIGANGAARIDMVKELFSCAPVCNMSAASAVTAVMDAAVREQLEVPELDAMLKLKMQIARGLLFDDYYLQTYAAAMRSSFQFAHDLQERFSARTESAVDDFHFHATVALSTSSVVAMMSFVLAGVMLAILTTPWRKQRAARKRQEHSNAQNQQQQQQHNQQSSAPGLSEAQQSSHNDNDHHASVDHTDLGRGMYKLMCFVLIAALATTACVTLADLQDGVRRIRAAHLEVDRMRWDLSTYDDGFQNVTNAALWFTQFGEERALVRYQDLVMRGGIFHQVEEDLVQTTTFEQYDVHAFEAQTQRLGLLRERFEKTEWFHRIAIRMMFPEDLAHAPAARRAISTIATQQWDVTNEIDYIAARIRFKKDFESPLMYTTSEMDYGRDDKARFLLSSQRYTVLKDDTRALAREIVDSSIEEWLGAHQEIKSSLGDKFMTAKVVLCVIIGISVLFNLKLVEEMLVFGSGTSQDKNQRGLREHFYKMTRQCRYALLVVEIMLVVLFVLMYVGETQAEHDVETLNKASSLQWLVAQSLVQVNRISKDDLTVSIVAVQTDLAELATQIRRYRDQLYDTGSASGDSIDSELMYETTYNATAEIETCRMGTLTAPAPYAPAPLSVDARLLAYVVGVEAISRMGREDEWGHGAVMTPAEAREQIGYHQTVLNDAVDPLFEGLQRGVESYRDAMVGKAHQYLVWCIFAAVATLVLIFVEYQFVFLPMIAQLIEEEDGTKLMLNMIPLEVRDAVPEIAQYFSTGKVDEDEKMKKLLQQSEKLLQNILPPIISRRLKAGEKLIADDHKKVTVSFCSLVGFDEVSKDMSAKQIVSFLNDLYSKFDALTDKLDLEKIKTIGDIYFMCGGLTEVTQEDHPLRVVETVLYFFEALNSRKQNSPQISMKAGINTGPAVAGVIGSKKVAYDLWGDAVNVSSRLCGTGLPGKIAVTAPTMEEVNEYYSFAERPVEAKGKGVIKTYILEGKKQKSSPYTYLFTSVGQGTGQEGLPRTVSQGNL